MDYFDLEFDDTLDERCAEVFLSRKGYLIFICTLCDSVIKGFPNFLSHIKKNHYSSLEGNENNISKSIDHDDMEKDTLMISQDPMIENSDDIKLELQMENNTDPDIDIPNEFDNFIIKEETLDEPQDYEDEDRVYTEDSLSNTADSENSIIQKKTTDTKPRRKYRKLPEDSAERKYKCDICGFGFRDPSNLSVHIRRHSDDKKRHACNMCPKRFHSRTELRTHIRSHTKERPYLCGNCGQAFITSSALSTHLKRHTNIRNSKCVACGKCFYDDALLRDHMTVHSGERIHECSHCNATFSRRKALTCHMKLHENKLEYKCELCSAQFNQKPGLYSHMKSKHKITPPPSLKSIAVAKRNPI